MSKKNIETLEAPVTGGQHRAESGNISILVSGKKKTFNKAFNLLSNIGHNILYCGKIGNASTLKVVTNYLASINLLSLGEALMVCKKYGLDLKTSYHGIAISSGNSFVHETESQLILNGSLLQEITFKRSRNINKWNGKVVKIPMKKGGNILCLRSQEKGPSIDFIYFTEPIFESDAISNFDAFR